MWLVKYLTYHIVKKIIDLDCKKAPVNVVIVFGSFFTSGVNVKMKNLATKNTNDFTVTETGEAFISQRKAAELLGVNSNTFKTWVFTNTANIDTSQGLTPEILQSATQYYAANLHNCAWSRKLVRMDCSYDQG